MMDQEIALRELQDERTFKKVMKKLFRQLDTNGNGSLGVTEVMTAARMLKMKPSREEAMAMIKKVDKNRDGCISYREFETMMEEYVSLLDFQDRELRQAFCTFDRDGNGYLDKGELKQVLKGMGEKMSDQEAEEVFRLVDVNRDGKISIDEFVRALSAEPHT
ncbi:calmodulin-A-like [Ylistrum balloti]|uniref:calmodulin-A-like n=1 Tax=Ylistrum balloti TaxID=509963 RepID=UPI002905DCD7|nr:calmodulin-A-like [Ylistrum balloti]